MKKKYFFSDHLKLIWPSFPPKQLHKKINFLLTKFHSTPNQNFYNLKFCRKRCTSNKKSPTNQKPKKTKKPQTKTHSKYSCHKIFKSPAHLTRKYLHQGHKDQVNAFKQKLVSVTATQHLGKKFLALQLSHSKLVFLLL